MGCGALLRHTTRSAHPEFQPEYPERVLERVSKMGHTVKNFGFPTAVVCSKNAPDVKGGKAKQCALHSANQILRLWLC